MYSFTPLSEIDLLVPPLLLIIIFFFEWKKYRKKKDLFPYYRYYLTGLFLKLFAGIGVCLIYVFYYGGGDTVNYFYDSYSMTTIFMKKPEVALGITFQEINFERWMEIDVNSGGLIYSYDLTALFVDRL